MAGSQLKQLKAALKTNGLTGQANVKKGKKTKTATEIRRDEREEVISNIRQQFNKFDTKTNRTKHDFTVIQGGKFVKAGSAQHNNSTQSRSKMEESLRLEYGAKKSRNGKTGGVVDRRFGENNKNMTNEEKMLERFTKERERLSKKNVFSLGSDGEDEDDDDDGFVLTHYGKSLALDDGESNTNNNFDDDVEDFNGSNDRAFGGDEGPARKKNKAEVMKEIIAKSKFYKHQRQEEHRKTLDQIDDLDEDFDDVMQGLNETAMKIPKKQFLDKKPEEIEYDNKVRELTYDRRSVPADRTKTEEEVNKEHEDKMKALETARMNRMNGIDDDRDKVGDDLDEDFWAGSDEEAEGFEIEKDDEESGEEGEESSDDVEGVRPRRVTTSVAMPSSHDELVSMLSSLDSKQKISFVNKVIQVYQPRLAAGNKEKMGEFTTFVLDHIMFLNAPENYSSSNNEFVEFLINKLKELADKYNERLVESIRTTHIIGIQERILRQEITSSDLLFYTIVGFVFSTSDHYHLIVTPTLILMNETLSNFQYNTDSLFKQIFGSVFIMDLLMKYTKFSKRIVPEVLQSLEKCLLLLVPEPKKINKSALNVLEIIETGNNIPKSKAVPTNTSISLQTINKSKPTITDKADLLQKLIFILEGYLEIWNDTNSLPEIISPFKTILKHLVKYYSVQFIKLPEVLNKLVKLESFANAERKPLALQRHKALAIATFAPKFEDNFNPDKKSYDVNRERQEIGKMKAQLKKEKKSTLKDLRKESRFVAREQIKEKKDMYDKYHKKMASIVNSISTIEGAEKNQYEKEKQQRKSRR